MTDLSNKIISHVKNNKIEFLQFNKLKKYENIIKHAYTIGLDRDFRTFKPDRSELADENYENNLKNYKVLCDELNLNYLNLVKANQNHTDNVLSVNKVENNKTIDTYEISDGLITNKKNIILATTNADCILLLFFDPVKKVIANTHSGWKGALQEISVKTVNKMINDYGCKPEDIIVCICPSIRKCHFEVGEDVKDMFFEKFNKKINTEKFIFKKENNNKWLIDTVIINKIILKNIGIKKENIEDCNICSICNKELIHSYRVEGENYGLATALITLV